MVFDQQVHNKLWASDGVGRLDHHSAAKFHLDHAGRSGTLRAPASNSWWPTISSWRRAAIRTCLVGSVILLCQRSRYLSLSLRRKRSAGLCCRLVGRLCLEPAELSARHRRLVGNRGVGLLHRWRSDLACLPDLPVLRRQDHRGTIAASSPTDIIWAPRRWLCPLLHQGWWRHLEPGHASRGLRLEYFSLGLLSRQDHGHRRPGPAEHLLSLLQWGLQKHRWPAAPGRRSTARDLAPLQLQLPHRAVPGEAGNLFLHRRPARGGHPSGRRRLLSVHRWRRHLDSGS